MRHDGMRDTVRKVARPEIWEYADILRDALIVRRVDGHLPFRADELLGRVLMNIGRCAVVEMTRAGQLTEATRHDPDFDANVTMFAVEVAGKCELVNRSGKEIFCYIRSGVKNRIKNLIRTGTMQKRCGEEVAFDDSGAVADFFGNYNNQQGDDT